ncbi:hypothetical protein [Leucothrix pacifica]|uniref:Uncharacterized protein n=1 Tax=Leucothrix pacifica TaxID=1247513 RepID=A0A317CML4_9GAMM|nr:hypothetical protein [Leucothrix pacifica]PWQ99776.1 hypothetical protein DKW60_04690 [Leucothrix pacifica]
MAPFLGIGGYGLMDLYMTNREDAKYYKLVPKGECKPVQDACEVEGRGLTLHIRFNEAPESGKPLPVTVTSATRLDDVALSIVSNGNESQAVGAGHDEYRKLWNTLPIMPQLDAGNTILRLAISEDGHMHLGEVSLVIN